MTKEEIEIMVKSAIVAEIAPMLETQRRYSDQFRGGTDETNKLEKGIAFTRFARSIMLARNMYCHPLEAAKKLFPKDEKLIRALGESTGTAGGWLVNPDASSEVIELLRPAVVVRKMGARVVPMNSNTLPMAKITGGATASYSGENTNIGKTEQTVGQEILSAKKLTALVPVSNELLADSSMAVDQLVRDDTVAALATTEDAAFIRYNGTQNKPKGIYYLINSANRDTSSGKTYDKIDADLEKITGLVQDSDCKMLKPGWLMAPRTWRALYFIKNTNGFYLYRDELKDGTLLGYPYGVTTQIPKNLGTGGDESELYFGDFADFVIGENEEITVDISTEAAYHDGSNVVAAFSLDQTVIRVKTRHDCMLRHDKSFAVLTGIQWGT